MDWEPDTKVDSEPMGISLNPRRGLSFFWPPTLLYGYVTLAEVTYSPQQVQVMAASGRSLQDHHGCERYIAPNYSYNLSTQVLVHALILLGLM